VGPLASKKLIGVDVSKGKDWIQTAEHGKFMPVNGVRYYDIKDIARALSNLCRFNGHVNPGKFYSVAEHSVRVSWIVEEWLKNSVTVCGDERRQLLLWALLHDASEAYIGDVTTPTKYSDEMLGYRKIEEVIQREIIAWAGLSWPQHLIISQADSQILIAEAWQLKAPIHQDWVAAYTQVTDLPANACEDMGWTPQEAEQAFLARYRVLK
jgi:hypothetical protein